MSKSKKPDGTIIRRTKHPTNPSVTIAEYVPAPAPGQSKYTTVNCHLCNKPVRFKGAVPDVVTCQECKERLAKEDAKANARIDCVCKTCGKHFYIKAAKAEQLKAAGRELFTTCFACQQAEKDEKEARRAKEAEERAIREAEKAEKLAKKKAEEATRIYRTCKICGKRFYIPEERAKAIKEAGKELFDTCYACRQDIKAYDRTLKDEEIA